MKILGIAFLSDASAVILDHGRLVAAVSEERLNRIKLWHGVPHLAIQKVLDQAGLSLEEIDLVATHGLCPADRDRKGYSEKRKLIEGSDLSQAIKLNQLENLEKRWEHEQKVFSERTPEYLRDIAALGRPMKVYGHHHCHAASAYYASGWDQATVLTADGWGEDGSSTVYQAAKSQMRRTTATETFDSLGYFYGSVTKALGFIPHRHEGKVLGLAAYCENPKSFAQIRRMVDYDAKAKHFVAHLENGLYIPRFENERLKDFVKDFSREDVSASVQKTLEQVVVECVNDTDITTRRLAVAGGIFANVKLNQRLIENPKISELFVFPNMGDGGLSAGAAYLAHTEMTETRPEPISTMYLGPSYSSDSIAQSLAESGLRYERHPKISQKVAELLAKGEVVARFSGAMEFGPRALGHRSLLYKATEPEVNEWLNKRLKRSEFMPFAPATLKSHANDRFLNWEKAPLAARFMATTFDCTKLMRTEAPAAVHVDGTARPQLIDPEHAPDFHAILENYFKLTGSPTLINTSFNMHEEPIVASPEDALRAIKDAELPYLAIDDFLVTQ